MVSQPWEHLQNVLMQVQNQRVREEFSDIQDDDNINTPRSSLKTACLLRDSDSALMTVLRMWLFDITIGGGAQLHPPLYTMPTDRYQQEVRFAPQVTMYFKEDLDDIEEGYAPIDAEISFRLMGQTGSTYSPAEAQALALRIRSNFAIGGGFRWQKGRVKVNYRDADRGYLMSLNAFSENEGRRVIREVIGLQGHTLDDSFITVSQMGATPPIVPPTEQIFGRSRRLPRKRPVGFVRFIYADLHIWGIPNAICLVDRSGRRQRPLVRA